MLHRPPNAEMENLNKITSNLCRQIYWMLQQQCVFVIKYNQHNNVDYSDGSIFKWFNCNRAPTPHSSIKEIETDIKRKNWSDALFLINL